MIKLIVLTVVFLLACVEFLVLADKLHRKFIKELMNKKGSERK